MRKSVLSLALLAVLAPAAATSASLQDVVMAAWAADNEWRAAQKRWQASQQIERQGTGGLLPQITAQYSHLRHKQHYEGSGTQLAFTSHFDTEAGTVTLVQPLFRLDTWYEYRRSKAITSAAEANFQQARQAFLLRAAGQYMRVLRTREELTSAEAEEKAIGRQLEQTRERYKVGLVPITEVHEAQAAYDLSRVGLIVAQSDFRIARDELESLTGKRWEQLSGLQAELPMAGPQPADAEAWVQQAREHNPQLLAALQESHSARALARQSLGEQLPQVDLIGQYQHAHVLGEDPATAFNPGQNLDVEERYYGVQVSMPLFAGGALNARRKEAALNYQVAQEQYRLVWREISRETLSLHRIVEADVLRVQARRQALVSAQSALQATESGYRVGTRNVVDVLNAQRNLYAAQRDYAGARYDYILDSLRLKAAAGALGEEDLAEVNAWLSAEQTVNLYPANSEETSATTR